MIRALILCVALASCAPTVPLSPEERAERADLARAFLMSGGYHVQPVTVPFYAMPPMTSGNSFACQHVGSYTYCN